MAKRSAAGFTLIELMVTIAIAAILIGLALPSFSDAIRSNRVSSTANQMLATINFARGEAVRSKTRSHVCPTDANATKCGTDWEKGMLVWTDENGNNVLDGNEVKRVIEPQKGVKINIAGTSDIAFDERGRTVDRATYDFYLQADVCKTGAQTRRTFEINRIGRVMMNKGDCQ